MDEIPGVSPGHRVDRLTVDVSPEAPQDSSAAVSRLPQTVKGPSENGGTESHLQVSSEKADPASVRNESRCPRKDLDDGPIFLDEDDSATAKIAVGTDDLDGLVVADALDAVNDDKRPFDGFQAPVFGKTHR